MLYIIVFFSWSIWIAATSGTVAGCFLTAWLIKCWRPKRYYWPITIESHHLFTIKGIIMQLKVHAGKEVPIGLGKPIKADQTPSEIEEGSLKITSDDETVATWERDDQAENPDDPYSGKIVWQGPGNTVIRITGDADLGDGVETIELDIEVEALSEEATGFAAPTVGAERDHVEESAAGAE